ncbi:WcbI family polysaccharide biosynthesis putative acetyltransferase [Neorhizobium alkalisoli]|uniref:WcbI family polysaccharide biosynthesis putative acetyltransferase n=1 Tax=Neorhizobium alkalisoli TaxID=528178 RepID=UPI0011AAFE0A|nr:WcbI family polysaccharide biosynthesis putative acetyltransferase [Neorhizobium alkalisoli]
MSAVFAGEPDSDIRAILDSAQRGELGAAIAAVKTYVAAMPNDVNGYLAYSQLLTRAYQHDQSAAAMQRAVSAAGGPEAFKKAIDRKVVLIVSNCHGKVLYASFHPMAQFAERFLFIGYYNVAINAIPKEILALADVMILQQTSWNDATRKQFEESLRPGVEVIRFPAATMLSLWPYYVQAPSKRDESGRAIYRYAYGDRFIDSRVRDGWKPEAILEAYQDLDLPSEVQLERVIEAESRKEFAKEANSDIKIRGYIEENFRRFPMFHTPNHPSRRVMNVQAVQVAERLQVPIALDQLSSEEYPETSSTEHPIHPRLVDYLRLGYRGAFDTFRMSRSVPLTFEQFVPLYIAGKI